MFFTDLDDDQIGALFFRADLHRLWLERLHARVVAKAFPHIGPSTSYTQSELDYLRDKGRQSPGVSDDPLSAGDASTSSHLRNLRDRCMNLPRGGPSDAQEWLSMIARRKS